MGTIFLIIIFILFLLGNYLFYKAILSLNSYKRLTTIIVYLVLIYVYFEVVNLAHIFLRNNKIYLELGHSSIKLIWILVLSYLIAILTIAFAIILKRKNRKDKTSAK